MEHIHIKSAKVLSQILNFTEATVFIWKTTETRRDWEKKKSQAKGKKKKYKTRDMN
jgi:hypothetical protein